MTHKAKAPCHEADLIVLTSAILAILFLAVFAIVSGGFVG